MIKDSFRFGFLVILLLLGMMIGITLAEKGINNVVGTPDANSKSFQVSQKDNQLEIMVFGESYKSGISVNQNETEADTSVDNVIEEQPVIEVEEKPDINAVGLLGDKIGDALQIGTEKGLSLLAKLID